MKDIEELEAAVKALSSKKAEKITALKIKDITSLANYFVIASGTSALDFIAVQPETAEIFRQIVGKFPFSPAQGVSSRTECNHHFSSKFV